MVKRRGKPRKAAKKPAEMGRDGGEETPRFRGQIKAALRLPWIHVAAARGYEPICYAACMRLAGPKRRKNRPTRRRKITPLSKSATAQGSEHGSTAGKQQETQGQKEIGISKNTRARTHRAAAAAAVASEEEKRRAADRQVSEYIGVELGARFCGGMNN